MLPAAVCTIRDLRSFFRVVQTGLDITASATADYRANVLRIHSTAGCFEKQIIADHFVDISADGGWRDAPAACGGIRIRACLLTCPIHFSQRIDRNTHHSSMTWAVIWNMSAVTAAGEVPDEPHN